MPLSRAAVSGLLLPVLLILLQARADAQDPSITSLSPQAVAPGTSADIILRGANLAGATQLWTNFPCEAVLTPDVPENGTKPGEVSWRLIVPPDVAPGIYGVRVATDKGASTLRLLAVDDLPSTAQQGNNTTRDAAQVVSLPVAIDGSAANLTRNFYKFSASAGQRLSVEVLARRIGSALDPVIILYDAAGRELTYSDDEPGLSSDSRVTHTFEAAGDYLLELRDIRYQGGGNHFYRLRIADFPWVSTPYPLGVQRGTTAAVNFAGPSVEEVAPLEIAIPADAPASLNIAAKRANGNASAFAVLDVGDQPEILETEPNNEREQATPIELGTSLNGRFDQPGDADHFKFTAKQGQQFVFQGATRRLGSPADLYLRLLNKDGGQLAVADDVGTSEGMINFTFPADGEYTLAVQDLHRRGGSEFAYRITVEPFRPGFTLAASAETLNVPAGGTALVTVTAVRQGYNGPIALNAADLPEGITATPTVLGPGQTTVALTLQSQPGTAVAGKIATVRIVGTARIGDSDVVETAVTSEALKARFNGLPWSPRTLAETVAVALSPAPAFTLRAEPAELVFGKDLQAKVKLIAQRGEGQNEAITLAITPEKTLPNGVTVAVNPIAKDQNEIELVFSANNQAALGEFTGVLVGTLKQGDVTTVQAAPGLKLKLQEPFALRIDAGEAKFARGNQLKVKVTAERNPAFSGPIKLTLQNLPTGVTADAVELPADQSEVEITLNAAADAQQGQAGNVTVQGEAMAGAAKLTAASPAAAITVE